MVHVVGHRPDKPLLTFPTCSSCTQTERRFCCPVTSRDFEPKARTSNAWDWMPKSEQRPARRFEAQRTSDPSRMWGARGEPQTTETPQRWSWLWGWNPPRYGKAGTKGKKPNNPQNRASWKDGWWWVDCGVFCLWFRAQPCNVA